MGLKALNFFSAFIYVFVHAVNVHVILMIYV